MNRFASVLAAGTIALGTVIVPTSLAPIASVAVAQEAVKVFDLGVFAGTGVPGTAPASIIYDQDWRDAFLKKVKDARGKYWDQNIVFVEDAAIYGKTGKSTHLQEAAKNLGLNSKEDYVNAISWDSNLERSAIQRAFEQTYTGLSHLRPNGVDWLTPANFQKEGPLNGVNEPQAENLAWPNTTDPDDALDIAFKQWIDDEEQNLKDNGGEMFGSKMASHIYNFLDPANKSMGGALVGSYMAWMGSPRSATALKGSLPSGNVVLPLSLPMPKEGGTTPSTNIPSNPTVGSTGAAAYQLPAGKGEAGTNSPGTTDATYAGTFSSDNPNVIAIAPDGTWEVKKEGTANISFTSAPNEEGQRTILTAPVQANTGTPTKGSTTPVTAPTAPTHPELAGYKSQEDTQQPGGTDPGQQQPGGTDPGQQQPGKTDPNNQQQPDGNQDQDNGSSMEPGAIAGLVVGILALLALIGIGANWQMIAPMLGM